MLNGTSISLYLSLIPLRRQRPLFPSAAIVEAPVVKMNFNPFVTSDRNKNHKRHFWFFVFFFVQVKSFILELGNLVLKKVQPLGDFVDCVLGYF